MGKRVAIIGFGVTGQSVARHLMRQGVEPVVLDTRAPMSVDPAFADIQIEWRANRWALRDVERAVLSPGLTQRHCLVSGARAAGIELVSDIDVFFEAVTEPVIGITGTNGKSTVTSLVGHMLNGVGINCGVGGNLGDAALDLLPHSYDYYALELSSFQLERSREHHFAAATVLNISADHLDHHASMSDYVASKHRIYTHAQHCVCNRADDLSYPTGDQAFVSFGADQPTRSQDWGMQIKGDHRWLCMGDRKLISSDDLALRGEHNEQNVLAAGALLAPFADPQALLREALSFRGLKHRFETIATHGGVRYVNDSKATNLGAAMAALDGMPRRSNVILIAGGQAKGVDMSPILDSLEDRVKYLLAIGEDAQVFLSLAQQGGIPNQLSAGLQEAVQTAATLATSGDVVLLSPACASFDMFDSYAQRGQYFARYVHELVEQADA